MPFDFKNVISLAPGFRPVWVDGVSHSRFNGFFALPKPLKRLPRSADPNHRAEARC